MSEAPDPYDCEWCVGASRPRWQLERHGDAAVTWACSDHLSLMLAYLLPKDKHRDRVTVIDLENAWKPPQEEPNARR